MDKLLKRLEDAELALSKARALKLGVTWDIGKEIRRVRKAKGLSLREVALVAGIAAPTLYDVELGRRFLSREKLEKVANHLTPNT